MQHMFSVMLLRQVLIYYYLDTKFKAKLSNTTKLSSIINKFSLNTEQIVQILNLQWPKQLSPQEHLFNAVIISLG